MTRFGVITCLEDFSPSLFLLSFFPFLPLMELTDYRPSRALEVFGDVNFGDD